MNQYSKLYGIFKALLVAIPVTGAAGLASGLPGTWAELTAKPDIYVPALVSFFWPLIHDWLKANTDTVQSIHDWFYKLVGGKK